MSIALCGLVASTPHSRRESFGRNKSTSGREASTLYVRGVSVKRNKLNPIISKFFNKYNTGVLNNPVNKWNCFIKLGKDVSSKDEKTNFVYRIDCNECAATYIGQIERRLSIRVNKHMKKCANKDQSSAIYTHMEGSNHKFNFNNVKVLYTEQSLGKRKLAEIHAQKQYINNQDTKIS